jgi:DNA-binding PadR family transcriptional regulator
MTPKTALEKFLPLSESTFYILLALAEPMHGYGIMQQVEKVSGGRLRLGPGTLYGTLSMLESENLICMVAEADRRKVYALTSNGKQLARLHMERMQSLMRYANERSPHMLEGQD